MLDALLKGSWGGLDKSTPVCRRARQSLPMVFPFDHRHDVARPDRRTAILARSGAAGRKDWLLGAMATIVLGVCLRKCSPGAGAWRSDEVETDGNTCSGAGCMAEPTSTGCGRVSRTRVRDSVGEAEHDENPVKSHWMAHYT